MRAKRRGARAFFLLLAALIGSASLAGVLAWRSLVTELAVSTASDVIVRSVNAIVKDLMREGLGDGLVTLEKGADGAVSAVTTNVAGVNALAAETLERAVAATQENDLVIDVPLGNVLGLRRLTMPVRVKMLSSSASDFRSELTAAGINQTRHRIVLCIRVDASLFMPWRVVGTSAETEILLSETVIVGDVPQSYLNWKDK